MTRKTFMDRQRGVNVKPSVRKTLQAGICVFLFFEAHAQSPFHAIDDSLISRGIGQVFSMEFDSALASFRQVMERYPEHTVGYFYMASTYQSMMMDQETDRWETVFFDLIEKAISIGEATADRRMDDPWLCFYLGSAYTYKGLYQAKNGSLISGFLSARKGMDQLKKALEKEPGLYDAYLGLGNYRYWSGRYYQYLKWLPWVKDEREEGIHQIRLSIEKGTFSRWLGINSLAWIEYDRKSNNRALDLFQMGLEYYPGSRFFLWGLGDTFLQMEDYDRAISAYEDLLSGLLNSEMENGFNEGVCRFKLIKSCMAAGYYEKAFGHCEAMLGKKFDPKTEKRLKDRIEKTRKYRTECLEKLGRVRVIHE